MNLMIGNDAAAQISIQQDDNSTRQLMSYLRELAKKEHIQTNVVDITPLGLVEMTRKNNGKTLKELIG